MVLHPKLEEVELEKEKGAIIEEINMYKDIPAHYVHEILAEMMWPNAPLGMPLAGTAESVRSVTRDGLLSYKEEYYNPKNMLLIGTGRITAAGLVEKTNKYLSGSPAKDVSKFEKIEIAQTSPQFKLTTKDTEQTHLAIGLHTIDRFHPDRHVLSLLNIILGANMSSRLFHTVRDEMARCYEISSSIRRYEDCGAFAVSAGVDDKKLLKALEVIFRELSRMKKEPLENDELKRAKEYYKGQLLFALEDTMSHMLWLGEKIISGEKDFSVHSVLEHIDKVNAEDLMRVSQGIFKDANLNLAVIGPVKEEGIYKEALHIA